MTKVYSGDNETVSADAIRSLTWTEIHEDSYGGNWADFTVFVVCILKKLTKLRN